LPVLYFTVTTDLTYDQRMIRICTSLANAGYDVTLVGRKKRDSAPIAAMPYKQKRIPCFFETGKMFYLEYNLRLFFYLLFKKMDGICAIDLDTILPVYYVSRLKKVKRIYDAHELFCEMKEIVTRPNIYKAWKYIERKTVPHFKYGYTVNQPIADEFRKMYGSDFGIIRSIALYDASLQQKEKEKFILYQGAVNEGRSFETLIPAMLQVNAKLKIYGKGNFFEQVKQLIKDYKVEDKVELLGFVVPQELKQITPQAYIAVTLFEQTGLNQFYSLSNRFFDYIMAAVPQVCVNYPEYKTINDAHNIALMIDNTSIETIADALNRLLNDQSLHEHLRQNCVIARGLLNWQEEEKILIEFYKRISDQ